MSFSIKLYEDWVSTHVGDAKFQMATIEFVLKSIGRAASPIYHAVNNVNYGLGTSGLFGHTKIKNIVSRYDPDNKAYIPVDGEALAASFGQALYNEKADNDHASTLSDYGLGDTTRFGHTKVLSKTPYAGYEYIAGEALSAKDGLALYMEKAPNIHAVGDGDTYGKGTTGLFGHVALVEGLTSSSYVDGMALSAHQGYVLDQGKAPMTHYHGQYDTIESVDSKLNGLFAVGTTRFVAGYATSITGNGASVTIGLNNGANIDFTGVITVPTPAL
jgi:hypothetical protein